MARHLHFVQSIEPLQGGGLGRAALELSNAFAEAGACSHVVATRGGATQKNGTLFDYGRMGPERAFFAPGLFRDVADLVKDADFVHGHGFYVATNWLLGRQARKQSKPLIYHAHGIFEPWILARSRWKKALAHSLFENANFRYARLWRALTSKEADQIRAQGISAPVVVCPNGIDLRQFNGLEALRQRLQLGKKKRELLYLGRLHPKKGLPLLLRAWAGLPACLKNEWCVVVAGPDELGHRGEIESELKSAGLGDEWRFLGSVSGETKLNALASADAFVLPSYSEGFSVAILEAMACRIPVLATHACNFPDLSEKGGGFIVPTESGALRNALAELFSEGDATRIQRGEAGRRLVEAEYTSGRIAAQIADACTTLGRT